VQERNLAQLVARWRGGPHARAAAEAADGARSDGTAAASPRYKSKPTGGLS